MEANRTVRRDPAKRPRYVYQCEACGDWHVSRYREYRPRVEDGTAPREQPGWRTAWERAARGETVTSWPKDWSFILSHLPQQVARSRS